MDTIAGVMEIVNNEYESNAEALESKVDLLKIIRRITQRTLCSKFIIL